MEGSLFVFLYSDCVETRYSILLREAAKHKKLESKFYTESIIKGKLATFMVKEVTCTSDPVITVFNIHISFSKGPRDSLWM